MCSRRQTPPSAPLLCACPAKRAASAFRMAIACSPCVAVAKLFEPRAKKAARLAAELAAQEAARSSQLVVAFGYELDKLGFYTFVSVSTVLLAASVFLLARRRRTRKRQTRATAGDAAYVVALALGAGLFLCCLAFHVSKAFDARKNGASAMGVGGYMLDRTTFHALVSTTMVLLVAVGAQVGTWCRQRRGDPIEKNENVVKREDGVKREEVVDVAIAVPLIGDLSSLDVVLVGCGPRSVGWFHLMQFLDMPNINVRAVVEPYYLDKRQCPNPPDSFVDLVMMLDQMGVRCVQRLNQLEPFGERTLCVVAGRSCDNPRFFRECIAMGASHMYLEVPGAPTVAQLKDMDSLATKQGVEVYMGYQRLCAPFVEDAVALSYANPRSHVFFCHNEDYPSGELPLVVGRFPEGLVCSMAAQELAVLVTHYGVRVEAIVSFKVNTNRLFSEKQTYNSQKTGKQKSDFSRVAFKITTTGGKSVSVMADRCGGLACFAVVKNHAGKELRRFESHGDEQAARVRDELREGKEMMRQYVIESEEYAELKRRVVKHVRCSGVERPAGTASIQDGISVVALAEYCTREIDIALEDK